MEHKTRDIKAKKITSLTALMILAATSLSGCGETMMVKAVSGGVFAVANDAFATPEVNMSAKNYAAADYLFQQMKPNVPRGAILFADRLEEADAPGISSPLGLSIPREVGLRLMELGYTVYVDRVAPFGPNEIYPAPPSGVNPEYTLTGTYIKNRQGVYVNLRVINIQTGKITARYDYKLELSREVREAVKTPPKIYRVTKK